ncbi:unnamed protein product [Onchocerca flexuosa]|uniref:Uncharacterized protein n=1 Tax=Onchocerca flexuosa TaxID=387005 RepID=A0A183HJB4_9BILA|nr:unnamed protein product [Onchocerca flexuosa]
MQAAYSRGSAIFSSDNISTIVIIRDILNLNEQSIPHVLQMLHPKLDHRANLTKKLALCRALQELADNVEDLSFLCTNTKEIMDSFDQLHKEMASCDTHFDRLTNIIVNLYIGKNLNLR